MSKAWTFLNDSLGGIPQKIFDNVKLYIIDPLSNAFAPVVDMFKDMASKVIGFFSSFKIPGVDVDIPYVGKFGIGPWYPFKSNAKPAAGDTKGTEGTKPAVAGDTKGAAPVTASETNKVSAVAPATGSDVTNASKTNAETALARAQTVPSSNTVVNAPVMTNNKTTQVMRPPIRNTEPSVSSYLRSRLVT
jgi:hypothetical protein